MEKRLWLPVSGFCIKYVCKDPETGAVTISVQLGEILNVTGVRVTRDGKDNRERTKFTLNWATANARFVDANFLHEHTTKKKDLLRKVLEDALIDEYKEEFAEVLDNDLREMEPRYVLPIIWKKKMLRIPVEFMGLRNFSAFKKGNVFADLRIGHHLIVWRVQVFDGTNFVLDPEMNIIRCTELRALSKKLFRKRGLQEMVLRVFKTGCDERNDEFDIGINGYDPKRRIPPAICFR
jgi:hypothetical protein